MKRRNQFEMRTNERTNERTGKKKTKPQKETDRKSEWNFVNWRTHSIRVAKQDFVAICKQIEWKILYFNLYIRRTNNGSDRRNCHQLDTWIVHWLADNIETFISYIVQRMYVSRHEIRNYLALKASVPPTPEKNFARKSECVFCGWCLLLSPFYGVSLLLLPILGLLQRFHLLAVINFI